MPNRVSSALTLLPTAWSIQVDVTPGCDLIRPAVSPDQYNDENVPTQDWFDHQYWHNQDKITGTNHGRGITYFIQQHNLNMVLRRYLRGGMIAKCITQTFCYLGITRTRVYQEIALLEYMHRCELPVPRPIAGKITRHFGIFYRNQILIERIPNAQDLHAYLLKQPLPDEIWMELGRTIAKMHLAGVDHRDLNIENILLDQAGALWLIDFDKCGMFTHDANGRSDNADNLKQWSGAPLANLARLARSIRKKQTLHTTYHVSDDNCSSFLSGYTATLQSNHPRALDKIIDKLAAIFSCK